MRGERPGADRPADGAGPVVCRCLRRNDTLQGDPSLVGFGPAASRCSLVVSATGGRDGAGSISGIPLSRGDEAPTAALLVLDHSGGPELLGRDDAVREIAAALAGLAQLCDEASPSKVAVFLRRARRLLAARAAWWGCLSWR